MHKTGQQQDGIPTPDHDYLAVRPVNIQLITRIPPAAPSTLHDELSPAVTPPLEPLQGKTQEQKQTLSTDEIVQVTLDDSEETVNVKTAAETESNNLDLLTDHQLHIKAFGTHGIGTQGKVGTPYSNPVPTNRYNNHHTTTSHQALTMKTL